MRRHVLAQDALPALRALQADRTDPAFRLRCWRLRDRLLRRWLSRDDWGCRQAAHDLFALLDRGPR